MSDVSSTGALPGTPDSQENELIALRDDMLRFARLQLSDEHLAEDAVQEAMAGALRNADSFTRQASLKSWVFSILRHKIADLLRSRYREPVAECKECEHDSDFSFDDRGHWQAGVTPRAWGKTDALAHNDAFWKVFDLCLDALPGEQARVFMMREHIGLDSHEICEALELSASNLHVLLYRARSRLRACLSERWFESA